MNTPVIFPLVKLLKEKGYDIKIDYDLNQILNLKSAPTIADVVMWLYEKHDIWISVGGDCNYKFKFEIHTWNWYELEKTYRMGHIVLGETFWHTSSEPFNLPTEAYETAIEYILKNLI